MKSSLLLILAMWQANALVFILLSKTALQQSTLPGEILDYLVQPSSDRISWLHLAVAMACCVFLAFIWGLVQ